MLKSIALLQHIFSLGCILWFHLLYKWNKCKFGARIWQGLTNQCPRSCLRCVSIQTLGVVSPDLHLKGRCWLDAGCRAVAQLLSLSFLLSEITRIVKDRNFGAKQKNLQTKVVKNEISQSRAGLFGQRIRAGKTTCMSLPLWQFICFLY